MPPRKAPLAVVSCCVLCGIASTHQRAGPRTRHSFTGHAISLHPAAAASIRCTASAPSTPLFISLLTVGARRVQGFGVNEKGEKYGYNTEIYSESEVRPPVSHIARAVSHPASQPAQSSAPLRPWLHEGSS
jgi:hypothetical protein